MFSKVLEITINTEIVNYQRVSWGLNYILKFFTKLLYGIVSLTDVPIHKLNNLSHTFDKKYKLLI